MSDLLLVHGTVVTMDPARRIVEDGAVAVSADRIVEVGVMIRIQIEGESQPMVLTSE